MTHTIFKFTIYINEKAINLVCGRRIIFKNMQSYQRFIGAAFQMLVPILGGVYLGRYLDAYFHTHTPWFTLGFSLGSIAFAMLALIKSLPK